MWRCLKGGQQAALQSRAPRFHDEECFVIVCCGWVSQSVHIGICAPSPTVLW